MLKELEVSKIMFDVCYKRNLLVVFLILRYTMRMANTRQAICFQLCPNSLLCVSEACFCRWGSDGTASKSSIFTRQSSADLGSVFWAKLEGGWTLHIRLEAQGLRESACGCLSMEPRLWSQEPGKICGHSWADTTGTICASFPCYQPFIYKAPWLADLRINIF